MTEGPSSDFGTMEPLHIATAAVVNIHHFVVTYPISAVFTLILFCLFLLRFYVRLTLKMYTDNVDMRGKTVIVTGGNAGIGKAAAQELAKNGARVILGCRSEVRGQRAAEEIAKSSGNPEVVFRQLDLASFESVRAFASVILKEVKRLDVLINNAGITGAEKREVSVDGMELVMQSNHLGHFLLTHLLLDLLKKSAPSRIVNVSSMAHRYYYLDLSDINSNNDYNYMKVYANSKSANILFTQELARKLRGTGVVANSLHPGVVKTEIVEKLHHGIFYYLTKAILFLCGKSSLEGAQTTLYAAISPSLKETSGKYFSNCTEVKVSPKYFTEQRGKELWKVSEELVGISKKTN